MIEVWPLGTRCFVGDAVEAIIIGIEISPPQSIRYQVMWWNSHNERKTEWIYDGEIAVLKGSQKKRTIGFKE